MRSLLSEYRTVSRYSHEYNFIYALSTPKNTAPSCADLLCQCQSRRTTTVDNAYSRLPLMSSSLIRLLWSCAVSKRSKLDEQCMKQGTVVLDALRRSLIVCCCCASLFETVCWTTLRKRHIPIFDGDQADVIAGSRLQTDRLDVLQ